MKTYSGYVILGGDVKPFELEADHHKIINNVIEFYKFEILDDFHLPDSKNSKRVYDNPIALYPVDRTVILEIEDDGDDF
jgi:hypothetical protein